MRSSWPPPAPIIEHTQGTHPTRESSNRIKKGKGKGKEMVQTPSWGRGSGGGAPGSAHIGVAVVVG